MNTKELVELDTALLIAKYGLQSVLEVIASDKGISIDELRERIELLRSSRSKRRSKVLKTPDVVVDEMQLPEDRKKELRSIAQLFVSRRLFPNMRDVSAFLRRHGVEVKRLKSRNEAFKSLAKVLASLDQKQLRAITEDTDRSDSDDFALLAKRLMGDSSS